MAGNLTATPVWADSLGAKSACWLVETPDCTACLDPGVAIMHPSYPIPGALKADYERRGRTAVRDALAAADLATISHYHYDHYLTDPEAYDDTDLWVKDPNRWINDSQWDRAREFLADLAAHRGDALVERTPDQVSFADPYDALDRAKSRDFGDYQTRREQLLGDWRERFRGRVARWQSEPWVEPPSGVQFADGRRVDVGETTIRFSEPLFHGIEYARTGWVLATVVETPRATFVHTSDLEGPVIEDYVDLLVAVEPDVLFADGPPTYLLGYMLNRINLRRAVDNAVEMVRRATPDVTVWDHHLLRDPRFRARTERFWALREAGHRVETVAESLGQRPLVERALEWSDAELAERVADAERRQAEN